MIVGEYDYSKNFVDNPESTWAARFLFTVFMVDMAIVLMNLVLGLAVSGTNNFFQSHPGKPGQSGHFDQHVGHKGQPTWLCLLSLNRVH